MPQRLRTLFASDFLAESTQPAVACTTSLASDRAAIDALADEWIALHRVTPRQAVFQSYDWCHTWLDTFAYADDATYQAKIITVRDADGALLALFPLCVKKGGVAGILEWVGEPLIQYGDILLRPGADHVAIRRTLAETSDIWSGFSGLNLRKVRDDSRVVGLLNLNEFRLGDGEVAAIADFSRHETFQDYLSSQSSRTRKTRRRRRRQLEALGEVTFSALRPGHRARDACKMAIAWKRQWLAESGQTSRAFSNPLSLDVLVSMSSDAKNDTGFRAFVLSLDGEPVAIECAFVSNDTVFAYLGAYRPDMEGNSVGTLQMEDAFKHAFEAGYKRYDLLAPKTAYKSSWAETEVGVRDYAVPVDLFGMALIYGIHHFLRPLAKSAYYRLPTGVRRPLAAFMA